MAFGPIAQARFRIDVPTFAVIHKAGAPGLGQGFGAFQAAIRVIAAAHQQGGERQRLARNGCPAVALRV